MHNSKIILFMFLYSCYLLLMWTEVQWKWYIFSP